MFSFQTVADLAFGGLATDWGERVASDIEQLSRETEQQTLVQLAALEQTLARTESDEPLLCEATGDVEAAGGLLRVPFPAFSAESAIWPPR